MKSQLRIPVFMSKIQIILTELGPHRFQLFPRSFIIGPELFFLPKKKCSEELLRFCGQTTNGQRYLQRLLTPLKTYLVEFRLLEEVTGLIQFRWYPTVADTIFIGLIFELVLSIKIKRHFSSPLHMLIILNCNESSPQYVTLCFPDVSDPFPIYSETLRPTPSVNLFKI